MAGGWSASTWPQPWGGAWVCHLPSEAAEARSLVVLMEVGRGPSPVCCMSSLAQGLCADGGGGWQGGPHCMGLLPGAKPVSQDSLTLFHPDARSYPFPTSTSTNVTPGLACPPHLGPALPYPAALPMAPRCSSPKPVALRASSPTLRLPGPSLALLGPCSPGLVASFLLEVSSFPVRCPEAGAGGMHLGVPCQPGVQPQNVFAGCSRSSEKRARDGEKEMGRRLGLSPSLTPP